MKDITKDEGIHILTDEYILLASILDDLENKNIELDLGCGKGDFTIEIAQKYPKKLVLAVDVMLKRLRKVQKKCSRMDVENVEILRVEARYLISYMLPDLSIDRIHILCPDPWPKLKHRNNRLICSNFLAQIHRVLKKKGVFHFATDNEHYFEITNRLLETSKLFSRDDTKIDDVIDIKTNFEKLWLGMGKDVYHCAWVTQ